MLKWEDPKLVHFGRGVEAIGAIAICEATGNSAKYGCAGGTCGGWAEDGCVQGATALGCCLCGDAASVGEPCDV